MKDERKLKIANWKKQNRDKSFVLRQASQKISMNDESLLEIRKQQDEAFKKDQFASGLLEAIRKEEEKNEKIV